MLAATSITSAREISMFAPLVTAFAAKFNQAYSQTYISDDFIKGDEKQDQDSEAFKTSHPFLSYAREHWIHHTALFSSKTATTWDLWIQLMEGYGGLAQLPWTLNAAPGNAFLDWIPRARHFAAFEYALGTSKIDIGESMSLVERFASEDVTQVLDVLICAAEHNSSIFLNHYLYLAVDKENLEAVEKILGTKFDINERHSEAREPTALQAACMHANLDIALKLMAAGADVNAEAIGHGGRTALQAACEKGHKRLAEILIGAGADVNGSSALYDGITALQAACEKGHQQLAEMLIGAGADVNGASTSCRSMTALGAACEAGHGRIVKMLIEAKAHVNVTSYLGYSVPDGLAIACEKGYFGIVEKLLEAGAIVNCNTASFEITEQTSLQIACREGYVQIVHILVAYGAKVNPDRHRYDVQTPLFIACEKGHLKVVEVLIAAGAKVNAVVGGETPLQVARREGMDDVVKALMAAGAKETPL